MRPSRLLGLGMWLVGVGTIGLTGDGTWRTPVLATCGVLIAWGVRFFFEPTEGAQ